MSLHEAVFSGRCIDMSGLFAMNAEELLISAQDFARLAPMASGRDLEEELSRATVVPEERMPGDIVRMHSRVTYVDETSGEHREVELVFPHEVDLARGRVSVLAPVGSALLGLKVNQTIDWPFPDGRPRRLRVARTLAPGTASAMQDAAAAGT